VAAVEHLGDLINALGPRRGVAGGRAQVDVPQARGDLVDRHASLKQVRGPVSPERVRVRQPLGHPGGQTVAAQEPVHGDGGEAERLLIALATKAHEQRLPVEQPDTAGERVDCRRALERVLDGLGHGHFALAPAFSVDVQAVVAGVGARPAQIPRP